MSHLPVAYLPFHVTCVMHNSRVSQRMMDYKVSIGMPEFLSLSEECKLIEILTDIIKEDGLCIISLNLCADHFHFIIVCNPKQLEAIVGKIKSKSARTFNIWRGLTKARGCSPESETRGHAPLSNEANDNLEISVENETKIPATEGEANEYNPENKTRGHAPLSNEANNDLESTVEDGTRGHAPLLNTRGQTQNSLWAQKFNRVPIITHEQLFTTMHYITYNRQKHGLNPFPKTIIELIQSILTPYKDAWK